MAEEALDQVLRVPGTVHLRPASVVAAGAVLVGVTVFAAVAHAQRVPGGDAAAKPSNLPKTSCPAVLASATRLITITTNKLTDTTATARLYRRARSAGPWQADGKKFRAVVGRKGLAWGYTQRDLARPGERTKREGDKRTPAGVFSAGMPFGLTPRPLANYLRLRKGVVCIDDPRSKDYSKILERGAPAGISHEKMWRVKGYSHGLVVRTPANGAVRSGSCIFLHVWRGPGRPTVGCVAFAPAQMKRIQSVFQGRSSAVAILPRRAYERLADCGLPRL